MASFPTMRTARLGEDGWYAETHWVAFLPGGEYVHRPSAHPHPWRRPRLSGAQRRALARSRRRGIKGHLILEGLMPVSATAQGALRPTRWRAVSNGGQS